MILFCRVVFSLSLSLTVGQHLEASSKHAIHGCVEFNGSLESSDERHKCQPSTSHNKSFSGGCFPSDSILGKETGRLGVFSTTDPLAHKDTGAALIGRMPFGKLLLCKISGHCKPYQGMVVYLAYVAVFIIEIFLM
ncbi:hypothetical protein DNTS_009900 [Danionella cerebrum]|uniref:Uncharacterized protein n=1 Tax=Danionella cerebrum TaxID=2873325 RepID=A0A553RDM2_9TELE|nr:hypothetical protein DNTS_009900 [Danionella translucida]